MFAIGSSNCIYSTIIYLIIRRYIRFENGVTRIQLSFVLGILAGFDIVGAISPACECVFFDGFGYLSNGTFTSPNFPDPYEPNTHCILYTFVGRQGELIALTFNYFELEQFDEGGKCSDYVKLYQDLDQPAVNEDSISQETLCGHLAPPSKTFYSRGRTLILEFHSDSRITEYEKGFSGQFRFLRQRDFESDGEKLDANSLCDYHVHSSNEMKRGKIFSPDYPYFYTPNRNCNFWFTGRVGERIRITVMIVDLTPTAGSCLNAEDSVAVYDGPGPKLGHGDGLHGDLLLGHYCGKSFIAETVTTSSEFAFMRFNAGPNSKRQARGFYATFHFYKYPAPMEKPDYPLLERKDDYAPACDFEFSSENETHGEVKSPGYPFQYPPNLRCTYTFRSTGIERVQIIFTDFDLYYADQPDKPQAQCRGEFDHLTAYVDLDGRMSEINTFCSTETPPQLMSSRNLMTLEFITNPYSTMPSRVYRGFKLLFRFVKDFGIKVGQKDPRYVCGFTLNSSIANNGTIYSPNYPGYYPRKTECHYTFRGNKDEKVRIFFTYFDVDGMGQCDNDSSSDYLEFSNYNTVDLKLPRFCGGRAPPSDGMESERDFYHLTFYSNSIFDGTGFFGFYQFIKSQDKAALKKVKLDSRSTAVSRLTRPLIPVAFFLFLLYSISMQMNSI